MNQHPPGKQAVHNGARSLTNGTLSGLLWTFSGSGAQALLQLGVLVILARMLTPTEFGIVGVAVVIMAFTEAFAQFGIGPAVVQRPDLREEHVRTATTISLCLGVLFGGVLWVASPAIGRLFQMEALDQVMRVVALVAPIRAVAVVPIALLQRRLQFRTIAALEVVSYGIGYGVIGIGLAAVGGGLWALVAAFVCQSLTKTILCLTVQRLRRPGWGLREVSELARFGIGYSAGWIGTVIGSKSDQLLVGTWLGAEALGLYGRARQFLEAPVRIVGVGVDKVLFAAFVEADANSKKTVPRVFRSGICAAFTVVLPMGIAGALLAPEVVHLMLGDQWSGAVIPTQILLLALPFQALFRISNAVVLARGAVYSKAWRTWLYAALVVGAIWAGRTHGINGVAAGVVCATAAYAVLVLTLASQLTSIPIKQVAAGLGVASIRAAVAVSPVAIGLLYMRDAGVPEGLRIAAVLVGCIGLLVATGPIIGSRLDPITNEFTGELVRHATQRIAGLATIAKARSY